MKSNKQVYLFNSLIINKMDSFIKIDKNKLELWSDFLFFLLVTLFIALPMGPFLSFQSDLSYFSPSISTMWHLIDKPFSSIIYLGRIYLLLFHYPILGGIITGFLLTLLVRSWGFLFNSVVRWWSFRYLIASPFLIALTPIVGVWGYRFDPSYPGILMWFSMPLIFAGRMFTKKYNNDNLNSFRLNNGEVVIGVIPLIIECVFILSLLKINTEPLVEAKMAQHLQKCEWDEMINSARDIKKPTRTIAALRTIALIYKNELGDKLFDYSYDYSEKRSCFFNAQSESSFYLSLINFYSGLVYPGYHMAMEHQVTYGVSIFMLKLMIKCSIINGENALADKYLHMLELAPFQSSFVRRCRAWIIHPETMVKDLELASVIDLQPVEDSFEHQYMQPTFIGYYAQLQRGRSRRSYYLSLAALLYAKQMEGFMARTELLRQDVVIPRFYQEAIALYALQKSTELLYSYQVSEAIVFNIKQSMNFIQQRGYSTLGLKEEFLDKFGFNYVYYMYFQNMPAESSEHSLNKEKGGVN